MTRIAPALFTAGSLSWALAQWLMLWVIANLAGGATAVGEYSMVLAFATPAFVVTQLGLRTVYVSLSVEYPWRAYVILRVVGLAAGVLLVLVYFAVAEIVSWDLVIAVVLLKIADGWFDLLQARLQRLGRLMPIGILTLGNSALTICAAITLLAITKSVPLAVIASAGASVLAALAARIVMRGDAGLRAHRDHAALRAILSAAIPTTLSEGLAAFGAYLPVLVISSTAERSQVGVFFAAGYVLTFANLSGAILKNVLVTPYRAQLDREGVGSLLRRARHDAVLTGGIGALVGVAIVLSGDHILRAVYGEEFGMSVFELALLAVAAVAIVPAHVYSTVLNVRHLFSRQAFIWAATICISVGIGGLCIALGCEPMTVALSIAIATAWFRLIGVVVRVR